MTAHTIARRTAAGALALVAGLTATSSAHPSSHHRHLDVTVVAVATPSEPDAADDALEVRRLGGRSDSVQSTSTATSNCDGCSATATAVTVVYSRGFGTTRADNVSLAWSSCADCRSRTVSVQVVVLARPTAVRAANRAFAANVVCTGCTTSALAYQLVVVAPRGGTFDRDELDDLARWAEEQAAALAGGAAARGGPEPPTSGKAGLADLEDRAQQALGDVTTLRSDVDTSTAGP